jgi:hypothetical protein
VNVDPLSDAAFEDLNAQRTSEADRGLRVEFFYDEIPDAKKTEEMGRPMFRSVEMCSIKIPGDKDNQVVGRVEKMNPDPRKRFAALYRNWKANGENKQVEGTLLRQWGLITPAEAKSYEAVEIFTVEQLAALSDATCQQYRGSVADRQKALDFLAQAKGLEPAAKARAENTALRAELDALKEQVAAMAGGTPLDAPKRRGRPPKAAQSTEA